ncbi:MAG: sodium/solute symporter [bacterium]|nr:sodium/solute symporter [bacterium]
MNWLDWSMMALYIAFLIWMAWYLGRKQKNKEDYYLGGNDLPFWTIGMSTMATQCSTNSLLGAPAFVIAIGGLTWLQYELAVPIAMIGIMIFLMPFFRKQNVISVYEYLEKRFGIGTRTILSIMFQLLRAFATGVTVYGISLVLQQILNIPFWSAVVALCGVTIVYDFFGGMKAVVYSDVIQMIILYLGVVVCLIYAIHLCGGITEVFHLFPKDKLSALDFSQTGLGDFKGGKYSFLPMFIGGLFLYMSYYGCDQTQVQREISTRTIDDTNASLVFNGFLRFPLVVTYCLVGVAIGAYIIKNPDFINLLKVNGGEPNFNIAVPAFVLHELPNGIIGLIIIALFSAAMSSLDSTINSLSATSVRDIYERFFEKENHSPKAKLYIGRFTTVFWGVLCTGAAFFVGNISGSIIASINIISSLGYGPILATFLLAIMTKKANDTGTVLGIIAGFAINFYMWIFVPSINWMWWNLIGCVVTFGVGYSCSLFIGKTKPLEEIKPLLFQKDARKFFNYRVNWKKYYVLLVAYTIFIIGFCYMIQFIPDWI